MGCDIHLFAEVRRNGKWVQVHQAPSGSVDDDPIESYGDTFYSGRSYDLFTLLADVRSRTGITPISPPRGIPDGVSEGITKVIERWDGDGHSHSYFTLNELMTYAYGEHWLVSRTENRIAAISSFFGTVTLDKLCEFLVEPGVSPDDIRIVFFFDN